MLNDFRHKAGRKPSAADGTHGKDKKSAHAVGRGGRRCDGCEEHPEGDAGTGGGETDQDKIAKVTGKIDPKKEVTREKEYS